jgi:ribosomal protein L11 methyltransferase
MTGDPTVDAAPVSQNLTSEYGSDMDWIELSIEADGEAAEAVSALFNRYSPGRVVFEELLPEARPETLNRVKTYLPTDQESLVSQIQQALWHLSQVYPLAPLSTRQLSQDDWMAAWKADYGVQHIGHHIVVKPSWQEHAAPDGSIVIEIDPGMAFGTGLHPSTRLSLAAIEEHTRVGYAVLDAGTGSGILAIAAAKMGAVRVVGIDIDSTALRVARDNVARNQAADIVSLQRASLCPVPTRGEATDAVAIFNADGSWTGAFDLLVMNILAPTIVESASAIATCLKPDGIFVVSGLTKPQAAEVRHALRAAGLRVVRQRTQKDWVALVGHRSSGPGRAARAVLALVSTTGA